MNTEHSMNRHQVIFAGLRALKAAAALALFAALAACSAGGAGTVVNQATSSTSTANAYTGPAPANADVQAFKVNFWENVRVSNRCGA